MLRRPPISILTYTPIPYTTLFRSRILGECFLHVADRIGAEAVRPLGAFQTIEDDEYDGADKGNQADQKPPSRPVGVVQSPHGNGQRRKQKREHRQQDRKSTRLNSSH